MSRNKVPTSLRPLRKSSSKTISKLMQGTQGREKSVPFDSLCAREGVPHQSSYAGRDVRIHLCKQTSQQYFAPKSVRFRIRHTPFSFF